MLKIVAIYLHFAGQAPKFPAPKGGQKGQRRHNGQTKQRQLWRSVHLKQQKSITY